MITVGAVSKGIIKRDQQHNVGAYKTTYQRNPFDSNTPEDIEQYLLEVERQKHDPTEEYQVRMQSSQNHGSGDAGGGGHIAHSHSGPVIPPASQSNTRHHSTTPPPIHSPKPEG